MITWKGWKEYHDACVDEFPGGFDAYGTPDEVKAECEDEFTSRINTSPPKRKPLTDEQIEALRRSDDLFEDAPMWRLIARAIEAAHGIGEKK